MRRRGRVLFRKWVRRILRIHDTPHSVAMGVSIGTFMGWGPLYGLHSLMALVIAALARVNKAAAVLACWTNNPVTMLPVIYIQHLLGSLLLNGRTSGNGWQAVKDLAGAFGEISLIHFRASVRHMGEHIKEIGWDVFWPWVVGSLISSVLLAAVAYPVARRAVIRHRHKTELRRAERHRRLREMREPHEGGGRPADLEEQGGS
jgi:uncharacterized protein (DUF2062 family)